MTSDVREGSRRAGRTRRGAVGVAALATALLLSSCGGTAPGVAATVEGDRITDQKVDEFAQVLCSLGGLPETEGGTPTRAARFNSLQILVSNQLAAHVADVDDVDQAGVQQIVQSLNQGRSLVPEDVRDTFDEVVQEFAVAEQAIVELGRKSLGSEGQGGDPATDDEAARAEGNRLRSEFAAEADIEVDPRFGTVEDGVVKPADGSLSVPVSDLAVKGAAEEPDGTFVSQLPATQKCS